MEYAFPVLLYGGCLAHVSYWLECGHEHMNASAMVALLACRVYISPTAEYIGQPDFPESNSPQFHPPALNHSWSHPLHTRSASLDVGHPRPPSRISTVYPTPEYLWSSWPPLNSSTSFPPWTQTPNPLSRSPSIPRQAPPSPRPSWRCSTSSSQASASLRRPSKGI